MLIAFRPLFISGLIITILSLSACMGGGRAPVYSRDGQVTTSTEQEKPVPQRSIPNTRATAGKPHVSVKKNHYRVVRGDTLYSIAWRYQLDYKKLAIWNGISSPYLIKSGKNLRLTAPAIQPKPKAVAIAKAKPYVKPKPPSAKAKPPVVSKPVQVAKTTVKAKPTKPLAKVTWQWPAKGKLISSNTVSSRNGIDIKGKMGQVVKAASGGKVVYSGSGLVGYGNLIIIKHNKSFLSAYAHNSHLLVSEGASVAKGEPIAEMGNSGTNQVKLHFEIRKDGKSVNPRKYLP